MSNAAFEGLSEFHYVPRLAKSHALSGTLSAAPRLLARTSIRLSCCAPAPVAHFRADAGIAKRRLIRAERYDRARGGAAGSVAMIRWAASIPEAVLYRAVRRLQYVPEAAAFRPGGGRG